MKVGFTGTMSGMNKRQRAMVATFLRTVLEPDKPNEFHHGDCIGADAEAFRIAKELGYFTVAHSCTLSAFRANTDSDLVMVRLPPLVRNKIIVDSSESVIATPKENEEIVRSGTWATIRYARRKGKLPNRHLFLPGRSV